MLLLSETCSVLGATRNLTWVIGEPNYLEDGHWKWKSLQINRTLLIHGLIDYLRNFPFRLGVSCSASSGLKTGSGSARTTPINSRRDKHSPKNWIAYKKELLLNIGDIYSWLSYQNLPAFWRHPASPVWSMAIPKLNSCVQSHRKKLSGLPARTHNATMLGCQSLATAYALKR